MEGIVSGESPRWHDGRLWFSDWGANQVLALGTDGSPRGGGGRRIVPDAHRLPPGRAKPWNGIVVDDQGSAHVNTIGFEFPGGEFAPGLVVLATPDGTIRRVAGDVARRRTSPSRSAQESGRWPVLHPARGWIVELAAAGDLRVLLARSFAFEDARDTVAMPAGPSAGTGGRYARPRRPGRAACPATASSGRCAACLGAARGSGSGGDCGAGLPVIICLR